MKGYADGVFLVLFVSCQAAARVNLVVMVVMVVVVVVVMVLVVVKGTNNGTMCVKRHIDQIK